MDTRDIKDELVEWSPAQQAEMEKRCEQDESHQHYPFGRADNQVAVTVPASILAPEKSWGMHRHNNTFRIFHNYAIEYYGDVSYFQRPRVFVIHSSRLVVDSTMSTDDT